MCAYNKKPILSVGPSLFNALFPLFFKNFLYFGVIVFFVYFFGVIFLSFFEFYWPSLGLIFLIIFLLTFLSISFRLFILGFTKYVFYESHAVKTFKFVIVRRRSVVYNRITNISLRVSLWDRITKAGTIRIHTGDDEMPDIVMRYIKNPSKVEGLIYSMIHKKNKMVKEDVQLN